MKQKPKLFLHSQEMLIIIKCPEIFKIKKTDLKEKKRNTEHYTLICPNIFFDSTHFLAAERYKKELWKRNNANNATQRNFIRNYIISVISINSLQTGLTQLRVINQRDQLNLKISRIQGGRGSGPPWSVDWKVGKTSTLTPTRKQCVQHCPHPSPKQKKKKSLPGSAPEISHIWKSKILVFTPTCQKIYP